MRKGNDCITLRVPPVKYGQAPNSEGVIHCGQFGGIMIPPNCATYNIPSVNTHVKFFLAQVEGFSSSPPLYTQEIGAL